jgi:hypothetical protein
MLRRITPTLIPSIAKSQVLRSTSIGSKSGFSGSKLSLYLLRPFSNRLTVTNNIAALGLVRFVHGEQVILKDANFNHARAFHG